MLSTREPHNRDKNKHTKDHFNNPCSLKLDQTAYSKIFSRVLRDSTPRYVGPSVGPSVRPSVRHFIFFCGLWPHCSCSNDGVISIIAPAHPHATGVAVYSAFFI